MKLCCAELSTCFWSKAKEKRTQWKMIVNWLIRWLAISICQRQIATQDFQAIFNVLNVDEESCLADFDNRKCPRRKGLTLQSRISNMLEQLIESRGSCFSSSMWLKGRESKDRPIQSISILQSEYVDEQSICFNGCEQKKYRRGRLEGSHLHFWLVNLLLDILRAKAKKISKKCKHLQLLLSHPLLIKLIFSVQVKRRSSSQMDEQRQENSSRRETFRILLQTSER